ncbi:MAG: hypothetical protein JXA33_18775 [Anaerolineae bacterium]|nr:hypothetical protein [Anaerolineae bacterium]
MRRKSSTNEVVPVILNPARRPAEAEFACNLDLTGKKLLAGQDLEPAVKGEACAVSVPAQGYAVYKCRLA